MLKAVCLSDAIDISCSWLVNSSRLTWIYNFFVIEDITMN